MQEPCGKVRENMQRHIHIGSWRLSRRYLHSKTGESPLRGPSREYTEARCGVLKVRQGGCLGPHL